MNQVGVEHEYTIRRKILTLVGAKFHIYNRDGDLVGYSRQKAFKLREDIRVYTDESMSEPLIIIQARSIIDFGAAYDVTDGKTGDKMGALRRKGFASLVRDQWMVLDPSDREAATVQEDSMLSAVARRYIPLGNLIPQTFRLSDGGNVYGEYRTHFNPLVHKLTVLVYGNCPVSPHLVLAGGILLMAIEGRQKG